MAADLAAIRARLRDHIQVLLDESIDDADLPRIHDLADAVGTIVAEVEELRRQVQAQRRVLKAAVATLMAGTDRPTGPLRPWQTAFRLGRAGLRLDSKHVDGRHVYAWYKHPQATVTGATLHALCHEVGRR